MSKCLLISDFNISNLATLLRSDRAMPRLETVSAPFGQVVPTLLDKYADAWTCQPDIALVWTRPESILPSFGRLVDYETVADHDIIADVDAFSRLVAGAKDRVKHVVIVTWSTDPTTRAYSMLDYASGGSERALSIANARLSENMANFTNVVLLDSRKWVASCGAQGVSPKLWYMAKIPYSNEVFNQATRSLKAALRALNGQARKLVIVDLDDTLWGGIVGDDGLENLRLGGHDAVGEAYADFQRALKALTKRGIILGIVSKNDESVAIEAIKRHPDMILRLDDFSGWRINWNDKAQNIVELTRELNLGLQSAVFLDDNPFERARIREALPEVLVPELPEDKFLYRATLLGLDCFDARIISREDLERTANYRVERQRESAKAEFDSIDSWLESLELKIYFEVLSAENLARTAQLFNKTNQLNLSTRRVTAHELEEWAQEPNRVLWAVRVADRFGDYGLTGIVSVEVAQGEASIIDFILSCRVMGRRVEETMLHVAIESARKLGAEKVRARYLKTDKNRPCLAFFERSGLQREGDLFLCPAEASFMVPPQITVVMSATRDEP